MLDDELEEILPLANDLVIDQRDDTMEDTILEKKIAKMHQRQCKAFQVKWKDQHTMMDKWFN